MLGRHLLQLALPAFQSLLGLVGNDELFLGGGAGVVEEVLLGGTLGLLGGHVVLQTGDYVWLVTVHPDVPAVDQLRHSVVALGLALVGGVVLDDAQLLLRDRVDV